MLSGEALQVVPGLERRKTSPDAPGIVISPDALAPIESKGFIQILASAFLDNDKQIDIINKNERGRIELFGFIVKRKDWPCLTKRH